MKKLSFILLCLFITACSEQSSESHLLAAKTHIEQQDNKSAIIELKNAIKLDPKSAEARFLLGKVYLDNREYQSAEKELSRALDLKYPANKVVPLLSMAFQKTRSDVALLELSHDEKDLTVAEIVEIAFYKLQALVRLEQKEKSAKLIDEIQSYTTKSPYKKLALVYSFLLDSNVEAAQVQLDDILTDAPKHGETLKLQGFLYAQSGDMARAVEAYLKYLAVAPEDVEATFVTARLLTDLNRTDEAEPLVDSLLAINDSNMLLNQLKGIARFNAKDNENALMYSDKALSSNPEDPGLRLISGYSAYLLENYETAHKHLSLIADKLPPSHDGLRILAASQLRLGLDAEAGDTVNLLEEISDKDHSLISSVGLALVKSGEINKARELLAKTENAQMSSAEDLTRLGLLQLSLNNVSGIANLELALDKSPDAKVTKSTLATAYLTTGQTEKALNLAQRWKSENETDQAAFMLAGLAYFNDKQLDNAKNEFEKLLVLDNNHQKAQLSLIDIAYRQKQPEQVKQGIEKLLSQQANFIPALIKLYAFEKQAGNEKSAMTRIENQFLEHQDNRSLSLLWGKILMAEQQVEQAIEVLERFAENKDLELIYWKTLGNAYIRSKNNAKAGKHYKNWLVQFPNSRDAVIGNLVILDNQAKYQQGLEIAKNYLGKRKNDEHIRLLHIHFLLQLGDFQLGKTQLSLLSEQTLSLPFSKGLVGQIELYEKKYVKALANLQIAYQAMPNAKNMRLVYLSYLRQNKAEAGHQFIERHVELKPNDLVGLMMLANAQISIDQNSAIASYEKALLINPKNFIALNNLAYFSLESGQLDKAEDYGKKALALKPSLPDVLDTVARIYLAKKDYPQAVTFFTKAVNTGEVSEEIYLNYIEALLLSNDKVLAKRKLSQREFKLPQSLTKVAELKKNYAI